MASTAAQRATLPGGSPADHLDMRDYLKLADLIGKAVGIKLPVAKHIMVEGRLRRRLRDLGRPSFDSYCRYLFDEGGLATELPQLIDVVTTNKTDFFREPEHFDLLASRLVPDLLAARRGAASPILKIWSAACSNGAEPYTIAMVLADLAASRKDFRFVVLGTDISSTVLSHAERGVYPREMMVPVPADKLQRHVMHATVASASPEVRVAPELRRLVKFARLNLMDKTYPYDRDVDVIFLRNVLIYFEKADQEAVIERLIGHLRPRGYLILGHSESMISNSTAVTQIAPAIFQKR